MCERGFGRIITISSGAGNEERRIVVDHRTNHLIERPISNDLTHRTRSSLPRLGSPTKLRTNGSSRLSQHDR
jgi:hypothetical protein